MTPQVRGPILFLAAGSVVALASALAPVAAAASALGVMVIAGASLAPAPHLIALPLMLVQVVGEGFRPFGVAIALVSATFLLIGIRLVPRLSQRTLPTPLSSVDRLLILFLLVVVAYLPVGIAGGASLRAVWVDLFPLAILGFSYYATRCLVKGQQAVSAVVDSIVLGSLVASIKALFLAVSLIPVEWDGPWQASRIITAGSYRVILRGADLFFVVTPLLILARWLSGWRPALWQRTAAVLAFVGMLLSGGRANWIGFLGGGLVLLCVGVFTKRVQLRRFVGVAAVVVAIVAGALLAPSVRSAARQSAVSALERNTLSYRRLEWESAVGAGEDVLWLGGGLGATFAFRDPGQRRAVYAVYSHNAFLQLALKVGVHGLLIFLFLIAHAHREAVRATRTLRLESDAYGLDAALLAVLLLSAGVNKLFTMSGSLFVGFALAALQTSEIRGRSDDESRR